MLPESTAKESTLIPEKTTAPAADVSALPERPKETAESPESEAAAKRPYEKSLFAGEEHIPTKMPKVDDETGAEKPAGEASKETGAAAAMVPGLSSEETKNLEKESKKIEEKASIDKESAPAAAAAAAALGGVGPSAAPQHQ